MAQAAGGEVCLFFIIDAPKENVRLRNIERLRVEKYLNFFLFPHDELINEEIAK